MFLTLQKCWNVTDIWLERIYSVEDNARVGSNENIKPQKLLFNDGANIEKPQQAAARWVELN